MMVLEADDSIERISLIGGVVVLTALTYRSS